MSVIIELFSSGFSVVSESLSTTVYCKKFQMCCFTENYHSVGP